MLIRIRQFGWVPFHSIDDISVLDGTITLVNTKGGECTVEPEYIDAAAKALGLPSNWRGGDETVAKGPTKPKCKDCMCWEPTSIMGLGECQCHAPVALSVELSTYWPITPADDRCFRDFIAKPPEPTDSEGIDVPN